MNSSTPEQIDGDLLLQAYINGIFPMADPEIGVVEWFRPDPRGVLPLEDFHVPRSLDRRVRSGRFDISINRDFEGVIRACSTPRSAENGSWMIETMLQAYLELFDRGFAHSVEARRDGLLVGGLYGIQIGGAFFGEAGGEDRSTIFPRKWVIRPDFSSRRDVTVRSQRKGCLVLL